MKMKMKTKIKYRHDKDFWNNSAEKIVGKDLENIKVWFYSSLVEEDAEALQICWCHGYKWINEKWYLLKHFFESTFEYNTLKAHFFY